MYINDLSETLPLDGSWQFFVEYPASPQEIRVPGCWEAQGYPKTLDGPVRYRRMFRLPANWAGQSLQLEFGAVSYACNVSVNGNPVGTHQGMWTPFSIDLTSTAQLGHENQIEVEVVKPGLLPGSRYPMRASLAGFLPDLATTFGGIWQPVRLRSMEAAIEGLTIDADYDRRAVHVQCKAQTFGRRLQEAEWDIQVFDRKNPITGSRVPCLPDDFLTITLPLPRVNLWSPDHPALYIVQVTLLQKGHSLARATSQVGFRRLATRGEQLLLNDKPFMVRGILSWGWEPDRIAPYYTLEQARAEIRRVREMGFNCIKLCLFVPNPAYYQAADEEGVILWQEFPMWLPEVTPELRTQAPTEYAEIADMVSAHPSVAIYSLGCELNRSVDLNLLSQLNNLVRSRIHDCLVCDNSGSGESYGGLDLDFADFTDYHPYYDLHYFEPLLDHWRRDWQPPRPLIFGEFCDSDTFRDLDEIIQANGAEPPWWMTSENPVTTWRSEAQALLAENQRLSEAGLQDRKADLVRISYAQAALIRKYTLEALRRRRAMGGYILTGLRDTAISTSGIWDDLGRAKWSAAESLQVNGDDVLTLDLDRRRTWRYGGDRPDRLDPFNCWAGSKARWHIILHAGRRPFPTASRLIWQLSDDAGVTLAHGEQNVDGKIPPGRPVRLGIVECAMPMLSRVAQLNLSVTLYGAGNRSVANEWPIWVYPAPGPLLPGLFIHDPHGLLAGWENWVRSLPKFNPSDPPALRRRVLSTTWDAALASHVNAGAHVLLLQSGEGPLPVRRCPFWREAIKFFEAHPLWKRFPHPGYTGMQFFGLASDLAFDSAQLPQALPPGTKIHPMLRRLDAREFHLSEYLFEARLGDGLLLGCTLNLAGGAGAQPAGLHRNVAGASLLQALLAYLARPSQ